MKTPNNVESDLVKLEANWKKSIADANFGSKEKYTQKEYSFSLGELRQMIKFYTIETLAKQVLDDKLNNDVLPRVGITPNSNIKVLFDLTVGKFAVWIPREEKVKKKL